MCGAILSTVGFPGGASGKESVRPFRRCKRHGFEPWVERSPGEANGNPLQYFLPGKSQGQRSLVGYSPQGRKESTPPPPSEHYSMFSGIPGLCPPDASGKPCSSRQCLQTLPNVPGVGWRAGRGRKLSGLRTVDSTYLDKVSQRGYPGST